MSHRSVMKAVVIGTSAGGMEALSKLLPALPTNFQVPVLIVQHIAPTSDNFLARHLDSLSQIKVKEANEKEKIKPAIAYVAPPNYHLLVEDDLTLSLTVDEKVNYSRPSIDVLFESAAYAFKGKVIAVVLTGANQDGAAGAALIKKMGGIVIVQDPKTAQVPVMPESVMKATQPDYVVTIEEIPKLLVQLIK
ncbi:MAG: two-component system, chemotaxis family, protein-glutamate methylesterase/glutaminase [Bacteroidales bacterium]|nr:two-component system, chemotaxis family, protein-glutamate methylesterase/glutaminase [Bacteroidales bacterium]MDN5328363.1 two-component system, chemotaxis family, protein-glutamate methylesterase/glutaminase [Bacteroidales bacterium]